MILSPSLLSADVGNLAAELSALEAAGLRWVHWDVMDGRFVPNITFGQHVIRQLRKRSGLFFDVHLMIVEPENYLSEFQAAGADMLVVHAEATRQSAAYARGNPASGHEGRSRAQSSHPAVRAGIRAGGCRYDPPHEREPGIRRAEIFADHL